MPPLYKAEQVSPPSQRLAADVLLQEPQQQQPRSSSSSRRLLKGVGAGMGASAGGGAAAGGAFFAANSRRRYFFAFSGTFINRYFYNSYFTSYVDCSTAIRQVSITTCETWYSTAYQQLDCAWDSLTSQCVGAYRSSQQQYFFGEDADGEEVSVGGCFGLANPVQLSGGATSTVGELQVSQQ